MPSQSRQAFVQTPYKNQKLMSALQATYGEMPLRELASAISEKHRFQRPLTHGTLHRALNGLEPQRAEWRAALGLPVLLPAPVCPKCGIVHHRECRVVPEWVTVAANWLQGRERR